jgi:hypothetical protein
MKARVGREYNGRLTKNTYLAKAYKAPDRSSVSITRLEPAQAFNEPYITRTFRDESAGLVAQFCFREMDLEYMLKTLRESKQSYQDQDDKDKARREMLTGTAENSAPFGGFLIFR